MLRSAPGPGGGACRRSPARWAGAWVLTTALVASLWLVVASASAGSGGAATGASAAAATHPVKTWTFIIGDTAGVDTMNPYVGLTNPDYEVYGMVWDTLMNYGQSPPYAGAPRLATSWSVSKNGLVWTYHLRHGVRWSDGVPFTSADVVWNFQRDSNPNNTQEYNSSSNYTYNIIPSSVHAVGEYTVVMRVRKPTPSMSELAGISILPKHIWDKISEKSLASYNPTTASQLVGTGPFMVKSFTPNQSITLVRNPHYWGGEPGIKEVVLEQFNNPGAEAFALQNGSIDFAENLTYQLFASLKNKPGITLIPASASSFDELAFNTGAATTTGKKIGDGNPALLDVNVRHAISYALDTGELVRKVFLGYAIPGNDGSMIPPMYPQYYYRAPHSIAYHYDPRLAGEILTRDGWILHSNGYRYKDGKELSLRYYVRSDSPTDSADAPYIAAWLQAIGINVQEKYVADSQLTNLIGNGNYDMFVWGWSVEPNPNFQLSTMTCGQRSYGNQPGNYTAGWSDSFYCNPSYDRMWAAQQSLAGAARARVIRAMEHQLYVNDPYSILYYYYDDQAYRSDLFTGFAPMPDTPTGLYAFQPTDWWSYYCLRPVGTPASLTDHNIGCSHEISPTKAQLASAGVTGTPPSGALILLIAAALGAGWLLGWLVLRRHDLATADARE